MPPKTKAGKEARVSAAAVARDPREEAVAEMPKKHGVYFRDKEIQQSPIYFISTHGEYDVNGATSTDDLFFVCPPNTYIFETAQIQNITSIDIDPYLWYLMQSKNRTLLFEIFEEKHSDEYFQKYFPGMDDEKFQYRIKALRHVCKHVIYYGPGQKVPIRKLTLSNIHSKKDAQLSYIINSQYFQTKKIVRASLRIMYASMGFWKFSKGSPYYTFPRVNLDYEYQRTLEEDLHMKLDAAIQESRNPKLIKAFADFEDALTQEEKKNTNYKDEDEIINKFKLYIESLHKKLLENTTDKKLKKKIDTQFNEIIADYEDETFELEDVKDTLIEFLTSNGFEKYIEELKSTVEQLLEEEDEEEEEENPLDTLLRVIKESRNKNIKDIATQYKDSLDFAQDTYTQDLWEKILKKNTEPLKFVEGAVEGEVETNVPENASNSENIDPEIFDMSYLCNPDFINHFIFQNITPPEVPTTTGGAQPIHREPEGCARILKSLYTPLNNPQNKLHVTNREIVMQDTSDEPRVKIDEFESPNIFIFSSCAAVTPKSSKIKEDLYLNNLKHVQNLQKEAIEEMGKNKLINPDTELGKSNLYVDTRRIENFTKVVEDGIIFLNKDPETIETIMKAIVKIKDPSLVTEETIPYEDWKYTYTYLDGGVDIFAEKEDRAIANAPKIPRNRRPTQRVVEAASAAAEKPKPVRKKGGAMKSRRKQKIQHTRKHKHHAVRSSTRSQKIRRFRKTRRLHN